MRIDGRFKSWFMVKFGDHIRSVPVEDISYFYIDFRLEELESLLDPTVFLE